MKTFQGKKMKMEQLFQDDHAFGVTPVKLETTDGIQELKQGMTVHVRGISKGKGFQGVVKRHGFHGGPKTHGQKNRHRAPGSIGNTSPQRVIPGRKMAGRMGGERVTVKNLPIIHIDEEQRIVRLHGAVPGTIGSSIELRVP